jgi:hypothetical protein
MFVPSGWWHVVMNLDTTIAVTQNFCSIANLPKVWPKTVKGRPQLALHWLKALRRERPELLPLIEAINRQNGIPPLDVTEPLVFQKNFLYLFKIIIFISASIHPVPRPHRMIPLRNRTKVNMETN